MCAILYTERKKERNKKMKIYKVEWANLNCEGRRETTDEEYYTTREKAERRAEELKADKMMYDDIEIIEITVK